MKHNDGGARLREVWGIAACIALYFGLRLLLLRERPLNSLFDEGVHLALMQMLAGGAGELYRDFLFIHPPGVIWTGAWLWPHVGGDIYALRLIYIVFCALGFVPLYLIARKLYGIRAALLTLLLLVATPGLANWFGRTIFLELPLNVFLYSALALLVCVPRSRIAAPLAAGGLCGIGFLIKETAAPAALAIFVGLMAAGARGGRWTLDVRHSVFGIRETRFPVPSQETGEGSAAYAVKGFWFGVGFLAIFVPLFISLASIPNYLHDTFRATTGEPFFFLLRAYELTNGFYVLPLQLTFGLVGVSLMARHSRSAEERFLGVYALTIALLMFVLPKRFYWRYLAPMLPLCCLGVWVWWQRFREQARSQAAWRTVRGSLGLFVALHGVSLLLYHTHEAANPPAHRTALRLLRESSGPLFTMDPLWAAASGQSLYSWRFACDFGGEWMYRRIPASDFTFALQQSPTALLNKRTLMTLPPDTERYLRQHYRTVYRYQKPGDRDYVEVLQRRSPKSQARSPRRLSPENRELFSPKSIQTGQETRPQMANIQ